MAYIHERWGALLGSAIKNSKSQVQEAFLAALIANESGGEANAKRLEKHVFTELVRVQEGRSHEYDGLKAADLADKSWDDLMDLATSWGLTQIMGWHLIHRSARPPVDLLEPEFNMMLALELLRSINRVCCVPDGAGVPGMFRCWNGGSINARTTDPNYVATGLVRMAIYEGIMKSAVSGAPTADESDFVVSDPEICL